jgi:hypothetical protein
MEVRLRDCHVSQRRDNEEKKMVQREKKKVWCQIFLTRNDSVKLAHKLTSRAHL